MQLNRIYVSEQVDLRLRNLKAKTGLTPNLLCRIGFCLSLAEPGVPDLALYPEGQTREFNRYTLTGQWDTLFFALLRERLAQDGLDPETELETQFKAHLNRGVMLLSTRIKSIDDIASLVVEAQHQARLKASLKGAAQENA
jgi:DNA sulfur modification protein DndE